MEPLTIIAVIVLSILLVWIVTQGGLSEPWRSMLIGVLALGLVFVILRLLGLV